MGPRTVRSIQRRPENWGRPFRCGTLIGDLIQMGKPQLGSGSALTLLMLVRARAAGRIGMDEKGRDEYGVGGFLQRD